MQPHFNHVIHHLFQKNDWKELSEEQIREFTELFPYAPVGHLLLACKLKQTGSKDLREEAAKTALYLNNPLWLHLMLNSNEPIQKPLEIPRTSETAEDAEKMNRNNESLQNVDAKPEITSTEIIEPVAKSDGISIEEKRNIFDQEEKKPDNEEMLFEPYHTIDYFASLGIKIKLEDLEKDRFGQQLKSFTEWLRGTKRIAASSVIETAEEETNNPIRQIAQHSVEGKEAETEAMAEVWAKQGNKEKAIAIYEKLSLRNPAKSHYFAAKIEQLKE